jgi:hypothetical protein
MPIDGRQDKAVIDAIGEIAKVLGKEYEYRRWVEFITTSELNKTNPSMEEIAHNTPIFIRQVSAPLIKIYNLAYHDGLSDATEDFRSGAKTTTL